MVEKNVVSDDEYGIVLDNFVIACVDVVIINGDYILLERRTYNPIEGEWWIFGGRMRKGESCPAAAKRGVLRELGLEIQDLSRFKELGVYNLLWPTRREPVAENGCHHLLVAQAIEVTDLEAKEITMNIGTKQNVQWMNMFSIEEKLLPEMELIVTATKAALHLVHRQ